jgi:hypothetical protein
MSDLSRMVDISSKKDLRVYVFDLKCFSFALILSRFFFSVKEWFSCNEVSSWACLVLDGVLDKLSHYIRSNLAICSTSATQHM